MCFSLRGKKGEVCECFNTFNTLPETDSYRGRATGVKQCGGEAGVIGSCRNVFCFNQIISFGRVNLKKQAHHEYGGSRQCLPLQKQSFLCCRRTLVSWLMQSSGSFLYHTASRGGEGLLGCPAGAIWGEATASDTIDLWWWCSLLLTTVLLCLTTSFPLWG